MMNLDPAARRRLMAGAALVFLAATLVYWPKLPNGFHFDDRIFINTDLSLRSWSAAPGHFVTDQARLYRPLRSVIYTAFIALFGQSSPVPFHLGGIFFHAVLSVLVVLIIGLMLADPGVAILSGLVFALHPVHADRVANITGSFDLFGLMLAYGAWFVALVYDRQGRTWQLWLAALLLLCGCLGSEEAVTAWLLTAGSFLLIPGQRKRRLQCLGLMGLMVLFYLAARTAVLSGIGRTETYAAGGLGASILTMSVIFWRYIGLLLFPVGLSPAYGPEIYPHLALTPILGLLGILVLIGMMFYLRKKSVGTTLALGWFLIGLSPFSNLLPSDTLMAERYIYGALGGFALGFGLLMTAGLRRRFHLTAAAILVLILISYSALTVGRCLAWNKPLLLWSQAAAREPNSFLANLNAGYHGLVAGRLADAERWSRRAAELEPKRAEPWLTLGEIKIRRGLPEEGVKFFQQAAAIDPGFCPAHSALAQGLVLVHDPAQAALAASRALSCDPNDPQANYVAGYLLFLAKRCESAGRHLQIVVQTEPQPEQYDAAIQIINKCKEQ